jgi:hypothetical protein
MVVWFSGIFQQQQSPNTINRQTVVWFSGTFKQQQSPNSTTLQLDGCTTREVTGVTGVDRYSMVANELAKQTTGSKEHVKKEKRRSHCSSLASLMINLPRFGWPVVDIVLVLEYSNQQLHRRRRRRGTELI